MLANKNMNAICAFFCLIVLYSIGANIKLQDFADDLIFSHALDYMSLHDYMSQRYVEWSGRLTLDALMVGTINHHNVWKIGIPVCVAILCSSISRIIKGSFDLKTSTLAMILFLLIPDSVLDNGAWWVTGFYNYLLPVTAMVYSFSVLVKQEKVGIVEGFTAILCLSISCFNEQTSIFTMVVAVALLAFAGHTRRWFSYLYLALAAAFSSLLFFAPGNYLRFNKETWRWMPGFENESLITKLTLGYDRIHQAIVMHDGLPFAILCILSLSLVAKHAEKSKSKYIAIFFLSVHLILIAFSKLGVIHFNGSFYNEEFLNPQKWISYSRYVSYLFTMMVILSVTYAMAVSACKKSNFAFPALIFVVSFATIIMIGFSPTVYASGMRVIFLWNVIIASLCLWIYSIQHEQKPLSNHLILSAMAAYFIMK
ncbi:hypothetical protein [Pantoea agglomerans]|uniref:hypothetical protein n=1 Tax=Enterobacter agglomerans TaxID=549 RepID=UPI003C7ADB7D